MEGACLGAYLLWSLKAHAYREGMENTIGREFQSLQQEGDSKALRAFRW